MESKEAKEILKAISVLQKDVTEVKENVRKILKVVSIENADFDVHVQPKKKAPTRSPNRQQLAMAAKTMH